jgi:hypothetical protein
MVSQFKLFIDHNKVWEGPVTISEINRTFSIDTNICICTYCDGWWNDGEIPKHNLECKRPQQRP